MSKHTITRFLSIPDMEVYHHFIDKNDDYAYVWKDHDPDFISKDRINQMLSNGLEYALSRDGEIIECHTLRLMRQKKDFADKKRNEFFAAAVKNVNDIIEEIEKTYTVSISYHRTATVSPISETKP